jgi:streptomycin 6-kinase
MVRERLRDALDLVTERLTPPEHAPATAYAAGVHDRFRDLARRWRVAVSESFETESSLIAYGECGGEPVVLKVVKRPGDEWGSGEVARAFGGRGMVRVLEHDDGAALFERIVPGSVLVELARDGRDAATTDILGGVIASMSPDAAPSWCPTVSDWGRGFSRYADSGDSQIPAAVVRRASEIYTELSETQRATRLLHGDLQHYNVLRDERRGWLAIDPKGVVGEVEYELGALLRNPVELPAVFADPTTIEKRVATLSTRLGLDAGRVLRWGFAQAVLSAIWHVEDGYAVDAETSAPLQLARALGTGDWGLGTGD